jgi:hypothetical protein
MGRAVRSVLVAALVMAGGLATTAQATVINPSWGYVSIDDHPFQDNGALLPVGQAFPRGLVKDAGTPDGFAVKLTVFAFSSTGANLFSYSVTESHAVYTPFDRRIDVSPSEISYLRYDFCRTTSPAQCEPSLRIGRPQPPPSTTPPGSPPPPPPPVDRDGDGVSPPADCNDTNSSVWPGAPEIPGNHIDDDCVGGDAPAKLIAIVSTSWSLLGRAGARLTHMRVTEAPAGAQVTVFCQGRRCAFTRRSATTDRRGEVTLDRRVRHRFRVGTRIEVRVTAPNMIGKVVRYKIRRGVVPRGRTLCLPPGAAQASRC